MGTIGFPPKVQSAREVDGCVEFGIEDSRFGEAVSVRIAIALDDFCDGETFKLEPKTLRCGSTVSSVTFTLPDSLKCTGSPIRLPTSLPAANTFNCEMIKTRRLLQF